MTSGPARAGPRLEQGSHPALGTDLGLSGGDNAPRSGFKELVAEVPLGHVSIIFGYELSRLAWNNSA